MTKPTLVLPTKLSSPECGTCKFFVEFPGMKHKAGQCRRRSPMAVTSKFISREQLDARGVMVGYLDGIVDGFFPPTNGNLWCGDYESAT